MVTVPFRRYLHYQVTVTLLTHSSVAGALLLVEGTVKQLPCLVITTLLGHSYLGSSVVPCEGIVTFFGHNYFARSQLPCEVTGALRGGSALKGKKTLLGHYYLARSKLSCKVNVTRQGHSHGCVGHRFVLKSEFSGEITATLERSRSPPTSVSTGHLPPLCPAL
jgi:hypothetical protein